MAVSAVTCKCDGSGKIVDRVDHSDEPWRDIGHGLQIGGGMSITSRLCECRKSLPRREGEARWWTSEKVWTETVDLPSALREVALDVVCEVPISDDNYPLIRNAENIYYPAMVEVNGVSFITDDIRRLAIALVSCADRADALDAEATCAPSPTPGTEER